MRKPLVAVAVAALLLAGGWMVVSRVESAEQRAAEASAPAPSVVAVPVERRVLSDVVVTRGDVVPEGAVSVIGKADGVVTGVPVSVGSSVMEGSSVVEVSGRPVFVIEGSLPVYRDVKPGSVGADVAQLQAALARMGLDPGEHDGTFGPGTKLAVGLWYLRAGYDPVQTSDDATKQLDDAAAAVQSAHDVVDAAELALAKAGKGTTVADRTVAQAAVNAAQRAYDDARIAEATEVASAQAALDTANAALARLQAAPATAPADLDAAKQAVTEATGALAMAKAQTASATANAKDQLGVAQAQLAQLNAAPDVSEQRAAVDAAQRAYDAAVHAQVALQAVTGVMVPAAELAVVPSSPAAVVAVGATVGAAPGTAPLVTLTTAGLVVRSLVDNSTRQLIRAGHAVTLDSELDGASLSAAVESVADAALLASETNGGQSGFPVVITPDVPLDPSWLGRNVRVTITDATSSGETLVVPEAALFARADGAVHVTRLDGSEPGITGTQVEVAVRVDLTAGGFAAITVVGGTLDAGDLVVVGTAASPASSVSAAS